jgi:dihydropyrimidinase
MPVDLVIKNALVVNSWGTMRGGVAVEDGKIVAVASDAFLPQAERTIDAMGKPLLPGIIDPHVHLNQGPEMPNLDAAERRAFRTETESAAFGGVTTVMTFLYKTKPLLEVFEETKRECESKALVNVVFNGTVLIDQHIPEMAEVARKTGITGWKYLMPYRQSEAASLGLGDSSGVDDYLLYLGMREISKIGYPAIAMIHTENVEIFWRLSKKLKTEGRYDIDAWWEARPKFAEEEYLGRSIYFSELTGARIYVVHMSIGSGVEIVRAAHRRGVNVFTETCPHYLTHTRDEVKKMGKLAKLNPPLRDKEDQDLLWQGIFSREIDSMGTDHCALTKELKDRTGDIWSCVPGFPGVATMLPVMLHAGVNQRGLPLETLAHVCSYRTAQVFGLYPQKGSIQVGADADLTLVDLQREVKVTPELLRSVSDYTLYDGWQFKGWPILTVVNGKIVMEDLQIVGSPGTGKYVPRQIRPAVLPEAA